MYYAELSPSVRIAFLTFFRILQNKQPVQGHGSRGLQSTTTRGIFGQKFLTSGLNRYVHVKTKQLDILVLVIWQRLLEQYHVSQQQNVTYQTLVVQ